MPDSLSTAAPARSRVARHALRGIRRALELVRDDPTARELVAGSTPEVIIESPLADWLYGSWWAAPSSESLVRGDEADTLRSTLMRVAALEAARRRAAGRSPGWLVLAATDGTVMLAPIERAVTPSPLRPLAAHVDRVIDSSRPGTTPAPGDLVTLARGVSQWDRDQGWWWAHGTDDGSVPDDPLDRWYVHARGPSHAAALMGALIPAFCDAGARYSLKCLPGPHGYGRADALVAYTPRRLTPRIATALRTRGDLITPHVAPDVVPTTRRILPGVSCAQDPSTGESFGQRRTAQMAALAARIGLDGLDIADALDDAALAEAASGVGIDIAHPERVGA